MLASPQLTAAVRRFPLLGRPRPDCPALPARVREIAEAVDTARHRAGHGMADAAHALNKAALIASDAGMTDLARHLCWQHIDTYRNARRPLTILEARYLLEPVLNLARIQIRTDQGAAALRLLESMYDAITQRCDLVIADQSLPLANLLGEPADRRQLRQWVWLQLIGEGIRALAHAGRWDDAADHARHHNGIGDHLMEGRQAAIIALCLRGDGQQARALLAESTTTEAWEQDVAACLQLMCLHAGDKPTAAIGEVPLVTAAVARYDGSTGTANYASYRARLGLTIATLTNNISTSTASVLLTRVAEDAINSADGYAARDVLGFRDPVEGVTDAQRRRLSHLAAEAGLGTGTLPQSILRRLTAVSEEALAMLDTALAAGSRHRLDV
ncbi:hypothetical protein [Paractinoplanes rishiriensis]|uniref:Uncharacterized protein n=1 Tax=Paractinoplanes rishiriensis TaxID=1050105 RepID=A0A919KA84_9ACTN|nr:hypothetical protein [Actinoplanes rishiriensis]GIF01608.1 hypothetical protein Ari01nite_90720 [Actinoplanes rishiriensis]